MDHQITQGLFCYPVLIFHKFILKEKVRYEEYQLAGDLPRPDNKVFIK